MRSIETSDDEDLNSFASKLIIKPVTPEGQWEFVKEMAVRFVESLLHATQEAEERSSLQIATMMALLRVLTSSLPSEELLEKACSGVASNKARLCACESARA